MTAQAFRPYPATISLWSLGDYGPYAYIPLEIKNGCIRRMLTLNGRGEH
jgi:hypothetical protein